MFKGKKKSVIYFFIGCYSQKIKNDLKWFFFLSSMIISIVSIKMGYVRNSICRLRKKKKKFRIGS